MKTNLFFFVAIIFAAYVQAEDSRITNFKNRSTKEDWEIQFQVTPQDYAHCQLINEFNICLSAGIYTPEITSDNRIIFKGQGVSSKFGVGEVTITQSAIENDDPTNVFLTERIVNEEVFWNIDRDQNAGLITSQRISSKTDPISGNYAITYISSALSTDEEMNILWLYLPDLFPEQGTYNDMDDSESSQITLTAVISLLILAILL